MGSQGKWNVLLHYQGWSIDIKVLKKTSSPHLESGFINCKSDSCKQRFRVFRAVMVAHPHIWIWNLLHWHFIYTVNENCLLLILISNLYVGGMHSCMSLEKSPSFWCMLKKLL